MWWVGRAEAEIPTLSDSESDLIERVRHASLPSLRHIMFPSSHTISKYIFHAGQFVSLDVQ